MKRPLMQVTYRTVESNTCRPRDDDFLCELTDQSISNIKKIITKENVDCRSLKERICWNPSSVIR